MTRISQRDRVGSVALHHVNSHDCRFFDTQKKTVALFDTALRASELALTLQLWRLLRVFSGLAYILVSMDPFASAKTASPCSGVEEYDRFKLL